MSTKKLSTIGILCAMAMVLNLLISFPMVPAVSFLKYDPKDIIIVIGGFIYGPFTALIMSFITSIIEFLFRGGTFIDIIMNIVSTSAFACTASYIYKKMHTKKGATIGLIVGMIMTTLVMVLWNYIVTPIYFGWAREEVIPILLPGIVPFNLLKSGINTCFALILYKPLVSILRRTSLVESTDKISKVNYGFIAFIAFILISIILLILVMQGII